MWFLNLLFYFLFLTLIGTELVDANASPVSPGQIPYIVSLRINNNHICGGSIISEYHILTAACCVDDPKIQANQIYVICGTTYPNYNGTAQRVRNIFISRAFRSPTQRFANDIALITLNEELEMTSHLKIIRLTSRTLPPLSQGTCSGWGETKTFSNIASPILIKMDFNVMNGQQCGTYPNFQFNYNPAYDSRICAKSMKTISGASRGDSGGPLVVGNELVGVVSHTLGNPGNGLPDIFISVYFFRNFINKAIRMSGKPGVTANTPASYFYKSY